MDFRDDFLDYYLLAFEQILADEINPRGLYSSNSNPYGIPFADWTAKWWQWFIRIPNSQQPFADATGEKCGTNQGGPDGTSLEHGRKG